jgi:hypothetical protein
MTWLRVPLFHALACASRLHKILWKWGFLPISDGAARICFTAARQRAAFKRRSRVTLSPTNFVCRRICLPDLLLRPSFLCLYLLRLLLYTIRLTAFLIPNTITNICYYLLCFLPLYFVETLVSVTQGTQPLIVLRQPHIPTMR